MTNNESHLGSRYLPSSFDCVIAIFYGELVASLCAPADHSSIRGACHALVRIQILIRMHRVNLNSSTPFHEANGFGTLYLCPASHLQVAPPQRSIDFLMPGIFVFSSRCRSSAPCVVAHPLFSPTLYLSSLSPSTPFCPLPTLWFGGPAGDLTGLLSFFAPATSSWLLGWTHQFFFVGCLTRRDLLLSRALVCSLLWGCGDICFSTHKHSCSSAEVVLVAVVAYHVRRWVCR